MHLVENTTESEFVTRGQDSPPPQYVTQSQNSILETQLAAMIFAKSDREPLVHLIIQQKFHHKIYIDNHHMWLKHLSPRLFRRWLWTKGLVRSRIRSFHIL